MKGRPLLANQTRSSRHRIVEAAIKFIRDEGLPGLTMRRLSDALGVVARLVEGMQHDDEEIDRPKDGWQDFQRLAHGVRRVALADPNAFPLIASRPPEAPWLRPPLRSLAWVETFLQGLVDEGFSPESAVAAYRAFTSFLLGHLLLEVSAMGADVGPLDVLEDGSPGPDEDDSHPLVHSLRTELSEDHSALEFEEALENLLDRLSLVRSEQARPT